MSKIIIVGGGFSGVYTAKNLHKYCSKGTEIELINDTNYFVFQPLLPEVASGVINAQDAISPLRVLLKNTTFRHAEVMSIDFAAKKVFVLQGQRKRLIEIDYDEIVLATGLRPSLTFAPGLSEHSLTMKNLSDAFVLRNHLIQCLEWADVTKNPLIKERVLTFIIAGGGFSGVETMGEIHDMLCRALRYYKNIQPSELNCLIVQRGERLLPELPEKLGRYTEKVFTKRGIKVMLNYGITSATNSSVNMKDAAGEEQIINCHTLVTTIGNGPVKLIEELDGLERGRIRVDEYLKAQNYNHTWALGDAALIPMPAEKYAPPTAQFAVSEANTLAKNLAASLQNNPDQMTAFDYKSRGSMASLGAYSGVAEVMGIKITGLVAWFVWRGFYILSLPGFATKLRVTLNWLLDYFVPRTIVKMEQSKKQNIRRAFFRKGDIVLHKGELLDGFYLVASGKLEIRVTDPSGKNKDLVKTVNAQEHLGDRIQGYKTEVKNNVTALEDTHVLILNWEDLVEIRSNFEKVDTYLTTTSKEKYPEQYYQ